MILEQQTLRFKTDLGGVSFIHLTTASDWNNGDGDYGERTYVLSEEEAERVLNLAALAEVLTGKKFAEKKGSLQEDALDYTDVDGVGWFDNGQLQRLRDVWGVDWSGPAPTPTDAR